MKIGGFSRSDKDLPDLKFGTPLAPRKKGITVGSHLLVKNKVTSSQASQGTGPKKKQQAARTTHNTRPSSPTKNSEYKADITASESK